jgi:hypothetical protein
MLGNTLPLLARFEWKSSKAVPKIYIYICYKSWQICPRNAIYNEALSIKDCFHPPQFLYGQPLFQMQRDCNQATLSSANDVTKLVLESFVHLLDNFMSLIWLSTSINSGCGVLLKSCYGWKEVAADGASATHAFMGAPAQNTRNWHIKSN